MATIIKKCFDCGDCSYGVASYVSISYWNECMSGTVVCPSYNNGNCNWQIFGGDYYAYTNTFVYPYMNYIGSIQNFFSRPHGTPCEVLFSISPNCIDFENGFYGKAIGSGDNDYGVYIKNVYGIPAENLPTLSAPTPPEERPPSILEKFKTLTSATSDWVSNGFPVAEKDQFQARLKICESCEFWDKSGFAGSGSCTKCGCSTQAKLRMATSKCPIDKWGAIEVVKTD